MTELNPTCFEWKPNDAYAVETAASWMAIFEMIWAITGLLLHREAGEARWIATKTASNDSNEVAVGISSVVLTGGTTWSEQSADLLWNRFVAADEHDFHAGRNMRIARKNVLLDETPEDKQFWRQLYEESRDE